MVAQPKASKETQTVQVVVMPEIKFYAALCFSKKKKAGLNNATLDTAFLDAVNNNQEQLWMATVHVGQQAVQFKHDTGAEVTAISMKTFRKLQNVKLCRASRVLLGPARQKLDIAQDNALQSRWN